LDLLFSKFFRPAPKKGRRNPDRVARHPLRCGWFSPKPRYIAILPPSSTRAPSTITEILISEVLIVWMLISVLQRSSKKHREPLFQPSVRNFKPALAQLKGVNSSPPGDLI
jgi:hypothetical protein